MRDSLGHLRLRFTGLSPLHTGARAEVYAGSDFTGRAVTVVVLTEPASADPDLREAYRHAAVGLKPEQSALDASVERPWVAFDGDRDVAVTALLTAVGEAQVDRPAPAESNPAGPGAPASESTAPQADPHPPVPSPGEEHRPPPRWAESVGSTPPPEVLGVLVGFGAILLVFAVVAVLGTL